MHTASVCSNAHTGCTCQEFFFKNGNLKVAVRNNAILTTKTLKGIYAVKDLHCQIRPSAQPDSDFGTLSLMMIHLSLNL